MKNVPILLHNKQQVFTTYDFLIQFACSSSKFALLLKCLSVLLHFYDDKFGLLQ